MAGLNMGCRGYNLLTFLFWYLERPVPGAALQGLGLIKNHVLPLDSLEVLHILYHKLVACNDHVEGGVLRVQSFLEEHRKYWLLCFCQIPFYKVLDWHLRCTWLQNFLMTFLSCGFPQYGNTYRHKSNSLNTDNYTTVICNQLSICDTSLQKPVESMFGPWSQEWQVGYRLYTWYNARWEGHGRAALWKQTTATQIQTQTLTYLEFRHKTGEFLVPVIESWGWWNDKEWSPDVVPLQLNHGTIQV